MKAFAAILLCGLADLMPLPACAQASPPPAERFDLEHRAGRMELPGRLREISGLAFHDGLLYAHDDERGVIYTIDPETEQVDRGFEVGSHVTRGDFEGLAIAGERFFLVTSRGLLYEFRAAAEGETVPARLSDTGLGATCEIEGLAVQHTSRTLVFVCKTVAPPSPEIRIHRFPLDGSAPLAPMRVPFRALAPFGLKDGVHPSGIEIDPVTGTFVIVAAREGALIEIDTTGVVLAAALLKRGRHPQAEGIAFDGQGRLFLADEGGGDSARLTWYVRRTGGRP